MLTGLDIEAKADWVREQLTPALTASEVAWTRTALPPADADTEEGASCLLRCTVKDAEPRPGRPRRSPARRSSSRSRRTPASR